MARRVLVARSVDTEADPLAGIASGRRHDRPIVVQGLERPRDEADERGVGDGGPRCLAFDTVGALDARGSW